MAEEPRKLQGSSALWRKVLAVVVVAGLLAVACGPRAGKIPTPARTPAPTATPTSGPTPAPAQDQGAEVRAYLAQVFPPGPGRDEVLLLCTVCHGIHVTILSGQTKDEGGWQLTRFNHEVSLVGELGESEEWEAIWKYLQEHFGSHRPPPPPPPEELLTGWQNYL